MELPVISRDRILKNNAVETIPMLQRVLPELHSISIPDNFIVYAVNDSAEEVTK